MQVIDNEFYDHIDDAWWRDDNFMALLRTAINPPRFGYFRDILTRHFSIDLGAVEVLDVGCGGGLLSEQFAQLGCRVTGIDQSGPSLDVARSHAQAGHLSIKYLQGTAQRLPVESRQFDVVCCCDVLEHVDDVSAVIAEISRALKPGGIFFFDTINRTFRSNLVAIKIAQEWRLTRFIPTNVHVWEKFIRPDELATHLRAQGFIAPEIVGLSPGNPLRALTGFVGMKLGRIGFGELGAKVALKQSKDLSISYMGFALRRD